MECKSGSEKDNMLQLMNAVLTDRTRRETVGKAHSHKKKRDKKMK